MAIMLHDMEALATDIASAIADAKRTRDAAYRLARLVKEIDDQEMSMAEYEELQTAADAVLTHLVGGA